MLLQIESNLNDRLSTHRPHGRLCLFRLFLNRHFKDMISAVCCAVCYRHTTSTTVIQQITLDHTSAFSLIT